MAAPGWYPDPSNPGKRIYWDGARWGEPVGVPDDSNKNKKTAVAIGVCVLAVVGLVMSFIIPGIGYWAHVGGLLAGFILYGLMGSRFLNR